jgi:hypothetical protein
VTNARRRLGLTIAVIGIGVFVLGAVIVGVAVRNYAARERQAIEGEWITVSAELIRADLLKSIYDRPTWKFYRDGSLDRGGYRCDYSINPLLHTIEWGDPEPGVRKKYELSGDSLKIRVYSENSEILYVLKRVGPVQW